MVYEILLWMQAFCTCDERNDLSLTFELDEQISTFYDRITCGDSQRRI